MNKEDYKIMESLIETRIAQQNKKIEAIESENKLLKKIIKEKIKYAIKMSKALDDPLFSEKFASDSYRERQQYWLKQLEGKK
nr:MAG: hypothetical protein [uncultured archaeon]